MILEVGVGEGRFADKVIKEGAVYVGIDISKRILNYAKEELQRAAMINLIVADAECLPFREKVFDGCFCVSTMFLIPDQCKAIKEMGRVAKGDLVVDFRNSLSPALVRHRLKMFLIRLRHRYYELKLKVTYASLSLPYLRKLAEIKYGKERVHRAVTNLDRYFEKSCKKSERGPYFPMSPNNIKRALKSANLQILSVNGFDLPEYSTKPIPCYSILKWIRPTLIIKARPMKAN